MLKSESGLFAVNPSCLQSSFVSINGDPVGTITDAVYSHIKTDFQQFGRRFSYLVFTLSRFAMVTRIVAVLLNEKRSPRS